MGLRFFDRASDGSLTLTSYHPADSATWHWAVSITSRRMVFRRFWLVSRGWPRTNQWHDYYRLPFGRTLIVSRQDFHRRPA
jgi:hypothetical protein